MQFNIENYEDHILDYLEGNFSAEEERAYENWMAKHPELKADEDLMRLTFLVPDEDTTYTTYSAKDSLKASAMQQVAKQETKVIPLYRKLLPLAMAAAMLSLFFWFGNGPGEVSNQVATENIDSLKNGVKTSPMQKKETEFIAEEKTEAIENTEDSAEPMQEQNLIAGLEPLQKAIESVVEKSVARNTNKKEEKTNQSKEEIKTPSKKPERFTKEDVYLDRKYNSTVVEKTEVVPVEPMLEAPASTQENLPTETESAVATAPNTEEVKEAQTLEAPSSKVNDSEQQTSVAAVEKDLPEQDASTTKSTNPEPAVVATVDKSTAVDGGKVLSGWQRVRASIQDEDSVLGYAARGVKDIITPEVLEKDKEERKKRTIGVNIKIASSNLAKTIKKLSNNK